MLPGKKKIEIWGLQTAGNALNLSILPSPCYFCIILNILRSHQADLFGSWGASPLPTGLITIYGARGFRFNEPSI